MADAEVGALPILPDARRGPAAEEGRAEVVAVAEEGVSVGWGSRVRIYSRPSCFRFCLAILDDCFARICILGSCTLAERVLILTLSDVGLSPQVESRGTEVCSTHYLLRVAGTSPSTCLLTDVQRR